MKRGILLYVFYALVQVSPSFADPQVLRGDIATGGEIPPLQQEHFGASPSSGVPQVSLGDTIVTGKEISSLQQDFFGGIPYAETPVGNLRLKRPVLKTSFSVKEFNASSYGYACIQPLLFPAEFMSEDCLTINIFRPSGTGPDSKLPVMFWTHGGGFKTGGSLLYNGSSLVSQSMSRGTPIIFVSTNYRLGPLGFPQGKEADQLRALNLGIYDQIAALEWVQHNIAAFGGDKDKVTAFGESAGAMMTSMLFLNYRIEGLARAAIFESGQAMTPWISHAERREVDWQNFVRGVSSCSSLATSGNTFSCLQAANSSEITQGLLVSTLDAPEGYPWEPAIDGPDGVLPDYASRRFSKGEFARLPFIAGTTLDEGTFFVMPPRSEVTTEDGLAQYITGNYSPPIVSPQVLQSHIKTLLQLYPDNPDLGSPYDTGNNTFGLSSIYKQQAAIVGDLSFQSQRRYWSQEYSKVGIKTYGYLFTEPPTDTLQALGVFHTAELFALYPNVTNVVPFSVGPVATNLTTVMTDYWVSFATSLDPNDGRGMSRPIWEPYTPQNEVLMELNSKNLVMIPDNYREKQIDFINSEPIVWLH